MNNGPSEISKTHGYGRHERLITDLSDGVTKYSPKMSAKEAWDSLIANAGLEVNGRDRDLVDEIVSTSIAGASSIDEFLEELGSNSDYLIGLIFAKISHYGEMYREIFDFFKRADAKLGDRNWKIEINDVIHDLEHFLEYETLSKSILTDIETYDVDLGEVWQWARESITPSESVPFQPDYKKHEINQWVEAYDSGLLTPIPSSFLDLFNDGGAKKVASTIATATNQLIFEGFTSRKLGLETIRQYWNKEINLPEDTSKLLAIETDHCFKFCVELLIHYLESDSETQLAISRNLDQKFDTLKTKTTKGLVEADFEKLQKLLNLPVWKERFDLYSVWVGVRASKCFDDKDIIINAPDGTISFPFKKTKVFQFEHRGEKVTLYSEVRTDANGIKLRGKGRTGAVQPDFAFEIGKPPQTALVIEVKHYKNPSRSFIDAVNDYGRVFQKSHILLVNHGGIPENYNIDVDPTVFPRTKFIGSFKVKQSGELNTYRDFVRDKVLNHPIFSKRFNGLEANDLLRSILGELSKNSTRPFVFIIDVSASMGSALKLEKIKSTLAAATEKECAVLFVDDKQQNLFSIPEALRWIEGRYFRNNDICFQLLEKIVNSMNGYEILFITDLASAKELKCFHDYVYSFDSPSGTYAFPSQL